MNISNAHKWKTMLTKVLLVGLIVLSGLIMPSSITKAAKEPTLTKSSKDILIGSSYRLNVTNKINKATYAWSSSNKKIASVDDRGVVTGNRKGNAVITCTVKAPDITFQPKCKVTVIMPALSFKIKDEVTALNVGQKFEINKRIAPYTSNDKITWVSSDSSIAVADSKGILSAKKEGTVTITGKTISGLTDTMTFQVVDKAGTVTNQRELNALLGSGAGQITIKSNAAVNLYVPIGEYKTTKLTVEAPKADIINYGNFAAVELRKVAANSWYENAEGNRLDILAPDSRIVVGSGAKVKLEVKATKSKLRLENNGSVEEMVVAKLSDINISGSNKKGIPVRVNVADSTITSSVPLKLSCTKKFNLVLLQGSERSTIQASSDEAIPYIQGNSTVKVTIGSGGNVRVIEIKPDPIGGVTPDSYTKIFALDRPITEITAINVSYLGKAYTINSTALKYIIRMLNNEPGFANEWINTTDDSYTYGGQTFAIKGTAESREKAVSFTGGQFDGKTFKVTMNSDSSVTIVSTSTNVAFTISKGADDMSLTVTGESNRLNGLTFTIVVDGTYTLEQPYTQLQQINISYKGETYLVNAQLLSQLVFFLSQEDDYLTVWKKTTNTTKTYSGQKVNVTGEAGSSTKTVTFIGGQLDGKAYTVTINSDHSVTLVSDISGVSFTVSKGTDMKSLTIMGLPEDLVFAPTF